MQSERKRVKRMFFIHQYEKEEAFLHKMRLEGWKFINIKRGIPTTYEFEKCEPESYSYCLDYVTEEQDTESYHQLLQDAGWEELLSWPGVGGMWYYFSKKRELGQKEELFTDHDSKEYLVNRLLVSYGLYCVLLMCVEVNGIQRMAGGLGDWSFFGVLKIVGLVLFSSCLLVLAYVEAGLFGLYLKRKKEKQQSL